MKQNKLIPDSIKTDVKLGLRLLNREGPRKFIYRLYWYLRGKRLNKEIPGYSIPFDDVTERDSVIDYSDWIDKNDSLNGKNRSLIQKRIRSFGKKPGISLILSITTADPELVRVTVDSILNQLYRKWDLCIKTNIPESNDISLLLREYSRKHDNIVLLPDGDAESGNSRGDTVLDLVTGDWLVLIDSSIVIPEHALYLIAESVIKHPDSGILYADDDLVTSTGERYAPYFKPDWDYEMFLGQNLIGPLGVFRKDLVMSAGGFRNDTGCCRIWDLALRLLEKTQPPEVFHIPFILSHKISDGDGMDTRAGLGDTASAEIALNKHFQSTGQDAAVFRNDEQIHLNIKRRITKEPPLVSFIIPTRDNYKILRRCIDGILERTCYGNFEIVIVDNDTGDRDALSYMEDLSSYDNVKIINYPGAFNYSRQTNTGVAASSGEICLLLNNDTDVINNDWLEEMVSHAIRPDVGAVGAKLYYPNGTLQHGGVLLGLNGLADHVYRYSPGDFSGYFNNLRMTRNVSCVTAACLAVRRKVYNEVGGFNEQELPVGYSDVDFCIRIRNAGYRIIWTPHAELYHFERESRGDDLAREKYALHKSEARYLRRQWAHILDNDPFYNPNLSLNTVPYTPAEKTRVLKPWLGETEDNERLNVLVMGKAKTGTTVISKAIHNSLKDSEYHMEPRNVPYFEQRVWNSGNNVVKILFEQWNDYPNSRMALISNELSCKFQKIIFILRDPRDELLSRVMYCVYPWLDKNGYDEEVINYWLSIIEQKENHPSEISLIDILEILKKTMGYYILEEMKTVTHMYINFLDNNSDRIFVVRYEDFIRGNRGSLERYLGLKLPETVDIGEFERTYRSGASGNWKEFYLEEDIEYIRSELGDYVSAMGYEEWELETPENLDPEKYSTYVMRLVNEYLYG